MLPAFPARGPGGTDSPRSHGGGLRDGRARTARFACTARTPRSALTARTARTVRTPRSARSALTV